MTHLFVTLTNAAAGREAEYAEWYRQRHIADMLKIPGVRSAQFFGLAIPGSAKWQHAAIYEVEDGSIDAIFAEIGRRRNGPDMVLTDAMDGATLVFLVAAPIGDWVSSPGATQGDRRGANCRLIALSRPVDGAEAEFMRWYAEQHLPDVTRIPGFVGAQRFALKPSGRGAPVPWVHLAVYAADAEDPATLMGELRRRAGTPEMPLTDALDRSVGLTALFKALTPLQTTGA